jgi:hypothetical protein
VTNFPSDAPGRVQAVDLAAPELAHEEIARRGQVPASEHEERNNNP